MHSPEVNAVRWATGPATHALLAYGSRPCKNSPAAQITPKRHFVSFHSPSVVRSAVKSALAGLHFHCRTLSQPQLVEQLSYGVSNHWTMLDAPIIFYEFKPPHRNSPICRGKYSTLMLQPIQISQLVTCVESHFQIHYVLLCCTNRKSGQRLSN